MSVGDITYYTNLKLAASIYGLKVSEEKFCAMKKAVNFCEEILTWGTVHNFKAEDELDSALVDTIKVRLFSPE